ncbi:alpha-(1,3)-fucosyltransferase 4-like [Liolophura sinensis]|uniref:alpha-(1,3)-fucosyltransferase 4-like n=1 Tax=Liolophura sinensis TaxID=3198878 RepID=UPI003158F46F
MAGVFIFTSYIGSGNLTLLMLEKGISADLTRTEAEMCVPKTPLIVVIDWSGYNIEGPKAYLAEGCLVTRDRSLLNHSQAVLITHGRQRKKDFPKFRRPNQRWIWYMDESPYNGFYGHEYGYKAIRDMFNWTMTYRTVSEVHIPYGWTTPRETRVPIPSSIGNRSGVAVTVMSNCKSLVHNDRLNYVLELQKYCGVEIYGRCGNKICGRYEKGLPMTNCQEVEKFLFYLAFENSDCKEYITEKLFSHGFSMGAVPVVMGAPKADYIAITPPNSFIHVEDFTGPKQLGEYLTFLSKNKTEYMKYHQWRRDYITSYRIQYVDDEPVWQALCRALKLDTGEPKRYTDLAQFWTTENCS